VTRLKKGKKHGTATTKKNLEKKNIGGELEMITSGPGTKQHGLCHRRTERIRHEGPESDLE